MTSRALILTAAAALVAPGARVTAQTPPSYGIDFVTIHSPGNAPCTLPDPGGVSQTDGRGSVPYEYRIGRTEITTGQWMEFVNTYAPLGGSWTFFGHPSHWGAEIDPTYVGEGLRYRLRNVANAATLPVGGINWRTAAMFCNWLQNGKATTTAAAQNGVYDTSTFTTNPDGTFNDQLTHSPGAQFWIPTLDEWMKAAHYDPNRYGPGHGGWWMYADRSDTPPIYAPPPDGQANAGFSLPGQASWLIPLGAYPGAASPWGLLDCAGATSEWLEDAFGDINGPSTRGVDGSGSTWEPFLSEGEDRATRAFGNNPWVAPSWGGFRIASAIPTPGTSALLLVSSLAALGRRRRRLPWVHGSSDSSVS